MENNENITNTSPPGDSIPATQGATKTVKIAVTLVLGAVVVAGFLALNLSKGNQHADANGNIDLGKAAYNNEEYYAAWDQLQPLAESGVAEAQFLLATMYDAGNGVPQNDTEAFRWYSKAAEQGHSGAQNNLGVMYYTGQGIPKNFAQAAKWYSKAAAQGHAIAQQSLAYLEQRQGTPSEQYLIEEINPDAAHAIRQNEAIRSQAMSSKCMMLQNAFGTSSPIAQDQLARAGCL